MIISTILTVLTLGCLFYKQVSTPTLWGICIAVLVLLLPFLHHEHSGHLAIDVFANNSRLNRFRAMPKFLFTLLCMIVSIAAPTPYAGLIIAVLLSVITVAIGGIALHDYLSLLTVPISFLMLSALALLIDFYDTPSGVLQIAFFQKYLCITAEAQIHTILVIGRALGAFASLYLLSLSTPMHEIIGVLDHLHMPKVIVELMYLIYRCIFILLSMHQAMKTSAESRLGFHNYRTSIRTTGKIYSNLLHRSYQMASKMFDAMESRCFNGEIKFLNSKELP